MSGSKELSSGRDGKVVRVELRRWSWEGGAGKWMVLAVGKKRKGKRVGGEEGRPFYSLGKWPAHPTVEGW